MSCVSSAVDLHPKSVLVAVDFSEASQKPVRHALAIARHYGAKLCLAHVISSLGLTMASSDAIAAAEESVWRDAAQLEDDLVRSRALAGLQYQFVIRQGEVWPELEAIIREQEIDLVVIGTHGRRGIGKLLHGSVAEEIFRHADCQVLTVGPNSYQDSRVDYRGVTRTFLFTTDFGEASLHALPRGISYANHFGAKLVFLHVISTLPLPEAFHRYAAGDVTPTRESVRVASLRRLKELTQNATLEVRPAFVVEFGAVSPVSKTIQEEAEKLRADVIIMGLHPSTHIGTACHMPLATAYEVVCGAGCPVLTVRR